MKRYSGAGESFSFNDPPNGSPFWENSPRSHTSVTDRKQEDHHYTADQQQSVDLFYRHDQGLCAG